METNNLRRRECIYMHLGQAGCQIGSAIWELYCCEHGIKSNGEFTASEDECRPNDDDLFHILSHFENTSANLMVPRCIFADTEEIVVDEIRQGPYSLFNEGDIINDTLDSGGLYIIQQDQPIFNRLKDRVHRMMEQCDNLQCIFYTHSLGGGSGPSLATSLMTMLIDDETNKTRQTSYSIFPFRHRSTCALEAFNAGQYLSVNQDNMVLTHILDNESLFALCRKHLDNRFPGFPQINRIIAQMMSCETAFYRYPDGHNCDIESIHEYTTPFPSMCYPILVYAPIISPRRSSHETVTLHHLNRTLFSSQYQAISIEHPEREKYMNVMIIYRGPSNPTMVSHSIQKLCPYTTSPIDRHERMRKEHVTQTMRFVKWMRGGMRLGYTPASPTAIYGSGIAQTKNSALLIGQYSGIRHLFTYVKENIQGLNGATIHYWDACCNAGYDQSQAFEAPIDNLKKIIEVYQDKKDGSVASDADDSDDASVQVFGRWASPSPYNFASE